VSRPLLLGRVLCVSSLMGHAPERLFFDDSGLSLVIPSGSVVQMFSSIEEIDFRNYTLPVRKRGFSSCERWLFVVEMSAVLWHISSPFPPKGLRDLWVHGIIPRRATVHSASFFPSGKAPVQYDSPPHQRSRSHFRYLVFAPAVLSCSHLILIRLHGPS